MIVTVHTPSVVHLPDGKVLFSGANTVDSKEFSKLVKHPVICAMVEKGTLSYDEKSVGSPAANDDEGYLLKLKVKEAQDLVGQTIDGDLLAKWLKKENRKPVVTALNDQIKALGEKAVLRSDDNSEDLEGDDSAE